MQRQLMTVKVLRGSKREIAESLVRLPGEVREVIIFIDREDHCTAAWTTSVPASNGPASQRYFTAHRAPRPRPTR